MAQGIDENLKLNELTTYAQKLQDIALEEFKDYSGINENSSLLKRRIGEYCKAIGIKPPANIAKFPWSATFVSWCVKTAGATASEFKFSAQHSVFVKAAIQNARTETGVFRGRPITQYAPKIGDIIQWNRNGGRIDYDKAATNSDYPSHSAIVVGLEDAPGGKRYAVTIGGNESNTIGESKIELGADGVVIQRQANPFICVIEDLKQGAEPAVLHAGIMLSPPAPGEEVIARRASGGVHRVHGPVVEAMQQHLADAGFPVGQIDGDFGDATLQALQNWQKSRGFLEHDAITAAQWAVLSGRAAPAPFDLCLQLTASFEGTGFTGAVGNFDGAGVTFGIIGFTAKHGELSELVSDAKRLDPAIVGRAFGALAGELEDGLAGGPAARVAFGQSISKAPKFYQLQPEWAAAFRAFGSEPVVRSLQVQRAYDNYWSKACKIFRKYGLEDMLDACLAYDIAVQNGGVKESADAQIRARLGGAKGEARRVIIAEAVRDASSWRNDVAQRKLAIAKGAGTVHGANYDLTDWGLDTRAVTAEALNAASAIFAPADGAGDGAVATPGTALRDRPAPAGVPHGAGADLPPADRFARREDLLKARIAADSKASDIPSLDIAGATRKLNGTPDMPDARDRFYNPSLIDVQLSMLPPEDLTILNQGEDGACTGFALAAVINRLNAKRRDGLIPSNIHLPGQVSPRMLYEMAKQHDEWDGTNYSGSSLRGAMKGFFHNGVCDEKLSPYKAVQPGWSLTVDMAKDARTIGLGSYYRLRPDVVDYHTALCDVGAICVSARVHEGWRQPAQGRIVPSTRYIGGHAFAIVGYDSEGFFVQNSWGPTWGGGDYPAGIAHWRYEDWADNVLDAWVLRLSVPIPDAFERLRSRAAFSLGSDPDEKASAAPRLCQVIGHIANIDDGVLQETGSYATPLGSFSETAAWLQKEASSYRHVMFFAHGGLNTLGDGATRAAALTEPFKRNGIYPIFWLWGTGGPEVAWDAFENAVKRAMGRIGSIADTLSDVRDSLIETVVRKSVGRLIWGQMKADAEAAFSSAPRKDGRNGLSVLMELLKGLRSPAEGGPQIHFVGHSAGSILAGHALQAMAREGIGPELATVQLLAPACTTDFFTQNYAPLLGKAGAGGVKQLSIYALKDEAERIDAIGGGYGKSLLYMVSNACEEEAGAHILGMQAFLKNFALPPRVDVNYADKTSCITASTTHGGFDNDLATMNTVLNRILGSTAAQGSKFREQELQY